jgi:carboxypeptidase C (cathepsin A)
MTDNRWRIARLFGTFIAAIVLQAATPAARADGPATQPATQAAGKSPETKTPGITEHDITLDGQVLHYRATAAELPITDDAGKERAKIFYIAYEKAPSATTVPSTEPVADSSRPVTFVFNGGPGSASVWLHMGTAGPRRA